MSVSSKFLTESTGEKIVKIGQYLAKTWTKYNSLLYFGPPCTYVEIMTSNQIPAPLLCLQDEQSCII